MYHIELNFTAQAPFELLQTSFSIPSEGRTLLCVRGKTPGAFSTSSTFQWTSAVRALCILLIDSTLNSKTQEESFILSGGPGSPASSLDYCIAKQPLWLLDMFGTDVNGRALINRIIKRSNTNRSLGGEVKLSLNTSSLDYNHISVKCGERLLSESELVMLSRSLWAPYKKSGQLEFSLEDINLLINTSLMPSKLEPTLSITKPLPNPMIETLANLFQQEALDMLRKTDIFSKRSMSLSINRLTNNLIFSKNAGTPGKISRQLDLKVSTTELLGLSPISKYDQDSLKDGKPIRVSTAGTIAAGILIFRYLQQVKGYNLELNYQYASTNDIVDSILTGSFHDPPDICLIGVLPAAPLFATGKSSEFTLQMIMPKASNRVVASNCTSKSRTYLANTKETRYIFCSERPTSASFCFEELKREGVIHSRKLSVLHMEPHEVFKALNSNDSSLRSILWFPHYHFNRLLNNCSYVEGTCDIDLSLETLLFVHDKFRRVDPRCSKLYVAIRDAWLELQCNPVIVSELSKALLSEKDFQRYLSRITGLVFASDKHSRSVPYEQSIHV